MKIINAKWTPKVNMLLIKCDCGNKFWQRADRMKVYCSKCFKVGNNFDIKNKGVYFERNIKNVKTN